MYSFEKNINLVESKYSIILASKMENERASTKLKVA